MKDERRRFEVPPLVSLMSAEHQQPGDEVYLHRAGVPGASPPGLIPLNYDIIADGVTSGGWWWGVGGDWAATSAAGWRSVSLAKSLSPQPTFPTVEEETGSWPGAARAQPS